MTVSVASFRADFPQEFGSRSAYPDQAIQYWLAMAGIILGISQSTPPQVASFEGYIDGEVLYVTAINFGSLNPLPLLLTGDDIPVNAVITGQLTGAPGQTGNYQLNLSANIASQNMVALQAGFSSGSNPYWGASSATPNSPPTTKADFAIEMWAAHQLVLEKQAVAAAAVGGDPGTKIGVISSKSVGGVSYSFDIGVVTGGLQESAGYYNQTIYGQRFIRLAKVVGSGPVQIGVGIGRAWMVFQSWGYLGGSNAWAGPIPGIFPSDVGFGG